MRILNFLLISIGEIIMVFATVNYHKLLRHNKEATYTGQGTGSRIPQLLLCLMYVFMAGFLVGMIDVLRRVVEPIYSFVAVIFFFGAIFIAVAINSQISMSIQLRNKTLEVMKTFVNVIDLKDSYTRGHSQQVYDVVALIYEELDEQLRQRISKPKLLDAAMLHDIGKLSVPDEVLNKKETLTPEDWELIKTHPANGKRMLDDTCFRDISEWVLYHHERLDSKGYYRLPGEQVPIESRIITVADTYCALCTNRIYRGKRGHCEAISIMKEATGSQLDPVILEALLLVSQDDLQSVLV